MNYACEASAEMTKSLSLFPAGVFRRLLILGLDRKAVSLCRLARSAGFDVAVLTGPRQLGETLADGRSAAQALSDFKVELVVKDALMENDPLLAGGEDALIFSTSSPFIIRSWLIERFNGRVINSHGTRLPRWRGGGGYSWQIMAGDRSGNSLVHLVTPRIDDGPIVYERGYAFPSHLRRPIDYMNHAERMDEEFLGDLFAKISAGFSFPLRFQDENISTYFPRLNSERQGYIDWTWPGDAIERFILAFSTPYAGAKTFLNKNKVHIFDGHFVEGVQPQHPFFAGLIVRVFNGRLYVVVEGGQLDIALADIVSTREIKAGDRLHTPRTLLDDAIAVRPIYTPAGLKT
jgi:methionyl-tRNA formyltransferase